MKIYAKKICLYCRRSYRSCVSNQKYCSQNCGSAARKGKYYTTQKEMLAKRICEICSKVYPPNRSNQKYCSKKCLRQANKARQQEFTEEQWLSGEGGVWLRLRFEILRRDDFCCQYCGRSAKEGVALHLDHVVPKSKGGVFEPSNLVTACLGCNLGKRDVVLTQREADPIRVS